MNVKSLTWGALGGAGIALVFYSVQALGMQSLSGPYYFFKQNWYFISLLIILFGVQVGLWRQMREIAKMGGKPVAASGGVSTGAMIACCLHNFTGILPIIGVTGLAVFFSAYQNYVFLGSILFSAAGLAYMIYKYQKIKKHCETIKKI